jgi:uncharacterized MnhB-related membrane protein
MKTLIVFATWVLASILTAVIPAVLLSILTPLTYCGVMTSPEYVAITSLIGTCVIGPVSCHEILEIMERKD